MSVPISSQQAESRADWKNATEARGVPQAARHAPFTHARHEPSADLAPFIEHYWHVSWDLANSLEHTQATLPHPSVHLVHERGRWRLYGVQTGPFTRTLRGRDQVFGVKFQPGMFRGFLGEDVALLTDRIEDEMTVLMDFPDQLSEDLPSLEAVLRTRLPTTDPAACQAHEIVTRIASDPALLRAEQVATASELQLRALQREL